ncbi:MULTISPECIES: sigma-54-dependent Fis family transcriptional regulator [unclassified Pseudomonas]|uniref:sigma-54 interaction domain-containing protein n=1 Tax=unclassified Pseudomonas TaxID=196821 RepID=UPI000B8A1679|nr:MULTISPECIES: sigma 54-interacting transcriptional regulator [unclassified Pseudomonas]
MFVGIAQPLRYAQTLLKHYANLSRATDGALLLNDFMRAATELSGCVLGQLYVLDASHTRLALIAECEQGSLTGREASSLPVDYNAEQLLQFALCQNRVLSLTGLDDSVHESHFLPVRARPWQSLLCVPLLGRQQAVAGLLVCASHEHVELQGYADSLAPLGAFALGHWHLLQHQRWAVADPAPAPQTASQAIGYGLIGNSAAMRQACQLIDRVLHSPYTVLLCGETGTGKEVVARAIHDCGPRRAQAFIVQNCAALPEHLLESELFGYRKGAFTGADRDRAGLFDAAHGGTLLLDEIGDMPLSLQAKLLRVLQEGEIRPLGCNDSHTIDVRILAATHRDLAKLVSEGKFREDLYYRLAQFPVELPALRDRDGDIPQLARHFADKACAFLQREALRWSPATLDHLAGYAFPGNVRELKGLVERAVLLCDGGELLPEHFALRGPVVAPADTSSLRKRLEQVERGLLLDCLRKNHGNQTLTARELGLPRRTLLYRLGRLKIHRSDCHD